jgi:hypothetical protein
MFIEKHVVFKGGLLLPLLLQERALLLERFLCCTQRAIVFRSSSSIVALRWLRAISLRIEAILQ